jgi:hypothetical protein
MSDSSSSFMKCPSCGAVNRVSVDRTCWVCDQNLDSSTPIRMTFYNDQETVDPNRSGGRFLVLGIVVLAVVGLTIVSPGLGILAIVLSIVPLGRMLMLMRDSDSTSRGFELYLGSFMVSIVICTVVGVTAFGAFCLSLFGVCAIGGSTMGGDSGTLIVYGITGLSVLIVCIPLGGWVLRRWRRDSEL